MEKTEGKGRHRMENSTGSSTGNSTENNTGRFIAQRRKSLGMTQRQLAEQLGVTNKAVSKWETGDAGCGNTARVEPCSAGDGG